MTEPLEHDWRRKFDAGIEALELLNRAGFDICESSIDTEPATPIFTVEADLVVGELTRPLDALENEDSLESFSRGYAAGFSAAMLACACDEDGECGLDPETGQCERDDCPL